MTQRSISRQQLREECALLERAIAPTSETPLPAELGAWKPGGDRNRHPASSAQGWFVYFRRLTAWHARNGDDGSPNSPAKAAADPWAVEALTEAALTKPSRVQPAGGLTRYLTVYPKSFQVLSHLYAREMGLARLQSLIAPAYEQPDFDPALMRRAMAALSSEHLLAAWIVTHPGPGMPWDPDGPPPAEIPAHITALDAVELHQLLAMNHEVNYQRLVVARAFLTPDLSKAEEQLFWSPFFAKAGELLGEPPKVLMRDHALVAVLLRVQLLGQAQRDAEAKREAEKDRD